MKDLGTLPGDSSSTANQINAMGQIIGMSFTYPITKHYFLYSDGVMQDISSLLPVGSGWTISSISGINNLGQIVGQGYDSADGTEHAILLSPEVPEPSSIALPMMLTGLAVARRYYRRLRSAYRRYR
jgi:probable HAF family extracellular repeat protein